MPPRAAESVSPKSEETYARVRSPRSSVSRLRVLQQHQSSASLSSSASSSSLVEAPSMLYRNTNSSYHNNDRVVRKQPTLRPRRRRTEMTSTSPSLSTSAATTTRQWMNRAWLLHFLLSLSILLCGAGSNRGSSKYIPIEPSQLGDDCVKAFLNSMATSEDEVDSKVCCDPLEPESAFDICSQSKLPMANRLKRFPEAWLLPLVPLLLRWFSKLWVAGSFSSMFRGSSVYMWRRLALYIGIMCVRGLVLYQGMNSVEDHLFKPLAETSCWYSSWLRPDQPPCYGRIFDFSDHVVLYFAQILPIAFVESLDFLKSAFVNTRTTTATVSVVWEQRTRWVVALCTLYLYAIICVSAFKTTAYFHTGAEVLAGYAVSLIIQLPLYAIQCHAASSRLAAVREWLFGPSASSNNNRTPPTSSTNLTSSLSSSRSLKSLA